MSTATDFSQPWLPVRRYSTCSSDGPIMVTQPTGPLTSCSHLADFGHLG